MKKYFLSILISLVSLVSLAQQPGDQLVKIKECRTCPVLWQAYTARNLSTFPLTDAGDLAMEAAAMQGAFTLRLANGAVVPAGTVPPRIPPNPTTVTWLTSVLASYDATTKLLYIEAAGASDVQCMFEQVSGAALVGSNGDGAQLVNSVFFDYGTNTASHPAQWRFGKKNDGTGGIPTNALRLTFRRSSNAAVTVAYTYTPKGGDTKIVLTGSSSSPPTDAAGPTWMSARYTYSGNRLDVEGAPVSAPNVTLNIKRADGQALSIQSSGGQALNTTDFYPSGPLSGQGAYTQEWSFTPRNGGGVPQVPIVLTWKKQDGSTYAKTFVPAPGTRTALFTASTAGGGSNPTTPPPVVGPAPTLAGGFAEGNLSQLMALAPFVPDQNQYASLPPANHTEYVDNGQAKFGLRKSITMGLTHFSVGGGENWINTFANDIGTFEGQTHADLGRSGPAWSSYGTPGGANLFPYCENGECTGEIGSNRDDTGWNGVPYGSRFGDRGTVLFYQRKTVAGYGDVLYTKTQPKQWSIHNTPSKSYIHAWYWLEGKALKGFAIQELFRDDTQMIFEEREQEWPFVYAIGKLYHNLLDTGTGVREVTSPDPSTLGPGFRQTDTGGFGTVGSWGACVGDDNRGVFLVTPYNSRFRFKQFGARFGNEFTNESAYVNAGLLANHDQNHTSAYSFSLFGGSLSEFQSWYAAQNISVRPFEFTFGPGKLCGWGSIDAYSKLVNNQYTFGIGAARPRDGEKGQGKFFSPYGAWAASSIPVVYIRGAFTNGVTKAQLQWRKAGNDTEFGFQFDVIGDGVVRTYPVPLQNVPNWSGIISTVALCNGFPRPALNGNETFIPVYIGATNPGN